MSLPKRRASLVLAAGVLALGACSSRGAEPGGQAGHCPADLPGSCPSPAPAYADVAPVFQERCVPCHAPGGQEAQRPLTSYADVKARQGAVLDQVYACRMPPASATPLTPADRKLLLQWLVCDAPP